MLVPANSRLRARRGRRALLFVICLAVLGLPTAARACKGGLQGKSPENPSAVLAVIGGAGIACKSLVSRIGARSWGAPAGRPRTAYAFAGGTASPPARRNIAVGEVQRWQLL